MMKKILLVAAIAIAVFFLGRGAYYMISNLTYTPQQGDVIFHVSESSQSAAIKLGTWSRYSHCGLIIKKNGKLYVLEAENGVELTPIRQWLKRGKMQSISINRISQHFILYFITDETKRLSRQVFACL